MIDVHCLSRPERGLYALRIRGHACYAPHGADIVCAAVSTLGYTFAAALQRFYSEGALSGSPRICEREGFLCILGRADKAHAAALGQTYETVKTGLTLLAESYPAHVRLR